MRRHARASSWILAALIAAAHSACSDGTGPEPPATADRLPGDPGAPAAAAIVREPYRARAQDFSTTNPDLPGVPISFNTIAIVSTLTATTGEVNGVLEELDAEIVGGIPGIGGSSRGILFLRLPIGDHVALAAALIGLRSNPAVESAAPDVLLGPTVIPAPQLGPPAAWTWQGVPGGDNWGLEMIRAPQLWNLEPAIARANGHRPITLVIDDGFDVGHPDLAFENSPTDVGSHGTHVAGTIGARYNNRVGVDGVNPFARMIGESGIGETLLSSWGEAVISRAEEYIRTQPDLRVINTSLGYNWVYPPLQQYIDATINEAAQLVAEEQGEILRHMLEILEAEGIPLPVWLTASGNDSGTPQAGNQVARWASPMANAALAHQARNIVVVEAVGIGSDPAAGATTRAGFSNLGGHLSAPGVGIMSADLRPAAYSLKSGTSMATPHVAGLVGFLYALAPALPRPTLASNPVLDLLLANSVSAEGGARPRIDAFSTAMDVDRVLGGAAVLRMLADLDDGTADGNRRMLPDGTNDLGDSRGDGTVDMSDFRRWRDWAIQLYLSATSSLDGPAHPTKRDLNGDSVSGDALAENVHPRGDLNGDGRLTIDGTRRFVPGAVNADVTDLEVLQLAFSDPHYGKAELPALLQSGDLHVDAGQCLSLAGVSQVRTTIMAPGGGAALQGPRTHAAAQPTQIYTLGTGLTEASYLVRVEALSAAGAVIASAEQTSSIRLGADVHWKPVCTGGATISLGWGGGTEPFGAEARAAVIQFGTGGLTCNVLIQPIPAPLTSPAAACQLPGGSASGNWTATVTGGGGSPLVISANGASTATANGTELDRWTVRASSFFVVFFTVSGGSVQYTLTGNVEVVGYRGTDWPATSLVELSASAGGTGGASAAAGCSATGCNAASAPLNASGTLTPGQYVISGSTAVGSGSFQSTTRTVTAPYSFQLTVTP